PRSTTGYGHRRPGPRLSLLYQSVIRGYLPVGMPECEYGASRTWRTKESSMLNLSIVLEDSARVTPDRTAIVFGDMRLPYSMINTVANQVANLLASRGIGRGDKVAIACPNLPYFPFVYYGILKAGATVVPL